MLVTFNDLLNDSLQVLQVRSPDSPLTGAEFSEGMRTFNALLESYSTSSLLVYTVTNAQFPLQSGVESYTMGVGGVFNSPRPTEILNARVIVSGIATVQQLDYPVVEVEFDTYSAISMKLMETSWPSIFYNDGAFPLTNINVWPVPQSSGYTLVLNYLSPATEITGPNTVIDMPPGYYRWLKFQGAVELAPSYQVNASQSTIMLADSARRMLEQVNARVPSMNVGMAGSNGGQTLTGVYVWPN